ncbi:MAG: hypothetical protein ACRDSH_21415 [Pseudonocardiaceae bacterium]
MLLVVNAPDLLEQGLLNPGGQLRRYRLGVPLGQLDQPSDEPLSGLEDFREVFGEESRVVGLLLREQLTNLSQNGR